MRSFNCFICSRYQFGSVRVGIERCCSEGWSEKWNLFLSADWNLCLWNCEGTYSSFTLHDWEKSCCVSLINFQKYPSLSGSVPKEGSVGQRNTVCWPSIPPTHRRTIKTIPSGIYMIIALKRSNEHADMHTDLSACVCPKWSVQLKDGN